MGGDYSRDRFNPGNDFSGILQQQGRVQLDSTANELFRIQERRTRAQTIDTIGRCAVPRETPDGFKITIAGGSLTIGRGRAYVDGLLAENHGTGDRAFDSTLAEEFGPAPLDFAKQPYVFEGTLAEVPPGGPHLVYLVVRERELTYLQRPDLVESAIGVDTVTALQTIWQVRVLPNVGAGVTCATPAASIPGWSDLVRPSGGRLTTGALDPPADPDPCRLESPGGYRGPENQLYRVEIHDGGPLGTATFKWSRDNGTVATGVIAIDGKRLMVGRVARDAVLRFNVGEWVEITDDRRELDGRSGEMRRIDKVHDDLQVLELNASLPAPEFADGDVAPARHLRVRRWDQRGPVRAVDGTVVATAASGVIPIPATGASILLEHGIHVTFGIAPAGGVFRAGDYWTFAARIVDAWIEPLKDAPPRGVHRHFCRLAVVTFPSTVEDCRVLWPPEAVEEGCACTVCVGPEDHAAGRPSLQDAVNKVVAAGGGTVCLDVGEYVLRRPLEIVRAASLRIAGKGVATKLIAPAGAVVVSNSTDVRLEEFAAICEGSGQQAGSAVLLRSSTHLRSEHLHIEVANPGWSAIGLAGALADVVIRDCTVLRAGVGVSVSGVAVDGTGLMDVRIENNFFECESAGVRLAGVSIHQHVSRIGGNRISGCGEAGIEVTGATIPGFGIEIVDNELQVLGDGIVAGLDGLRILRNDVQPLRASTRRGIVLTRGLGGDRLGDGQILENRIGAFARAIVVEVPIGAVEIASNQISGADTGIQVRAGHIANLCVDRNQITATARMALIVESDDARVSIHGNQLELAGAGPGVLVRCGRGDCLYGENHYLQTEGDDAMFLAAFAVIYANNRVIGRHPRVLLEPDTGASGPRCTVLGNIVAGEIFVNGTNLPGPWAPLNQQNA